MAPSACPLQRGLRVRDYGKTLLAGGQCPPFRLIICRQRVPVPRASTSHNEDASHTSSAPMHNVVRPQSGHQIGLPSAGVPIFGTLNESLEEELEAAGSDHELPEGASVAHLALPRMQLPLSTSLPPPPSPEQLLRSIPTAVGVAAGAAAAAAAALPPPPSMRDLSRTATAVLEPPESELGGPEAARHNIREASPNQYLAGGVCVACSRFSAAL
jgi:hypothetical protein